MNPRHSLFGRIVASYLLCIVVLIGAYLPNSTTLNAQDEATITRLKERIGYLAGEECAGRHPGTAGNKLAAEYIAAQFQKAGLKPLLSSYFQEFSVPNSVTLTGENSITCELVIPKPGIPADQIRPIKLSWKPYNEYVPLGYSSSAVITPTQVVFAGFGITDASKNYDDYASVDVKGKLVVIITGDKESTQMFTNNQKVDHFMRSRLVNAREHGAAGVIFIHPQGDSSDVLLPIRYDTKSNTSTIPVIHAKRSAIAKLFPKDRLLVTQEEQIRAKKTPMSFELPNVKIAITTSLQTQEATISNIIGFVPGRDPMNNSEYIVVGAHYDHLGLGDEHSLYEGNEKRIHYGADDNASGTAGVIELAERIAQNPLARPVIFIAFNAEERGLLGSAFYTKNPPVSLDNVVAMVNMDMIGRLKDNKLNVQGVGTSSSWKPLLDSVNKQFNFAISTTDDGFGPSDHSSFYAKDKPVLFFFTGLHSDYHRPTDTPDKINYTGEAKVIQFVEKTVRMIADMPNKPDFVKVKSSQSASTGFNVVFGVIPDYGDHPKGLHITGVREGSPAEKAGIKGDDVITKFGTTTVKNIYDLTHCLGKQQPGDVVPVTVLRNDKELVLSVTLTGKK